MEAAIQEAKLGLSEGGIPIGSVIVHDNKIIGRGHNRRIQNGSVTLHGEMDALENAGRQTAKVYQASTLYTTLSPCPMCSGAILLYGIPRVVIADNINFLGAEDHLSANDVDVVVINDPEMISIMKTFVANNPTLWNEDIGV